MDGDYRKENVISLKRYLKAHKLSQSGKKDDLVNRCEQHAARCMCGIRTQPSAAQQATNDELSDFNNRISKVMDWTALLKDWPELDYSCVVAFKASEKHNKAGYGLFKENKVENMLVGCFEGSRYCKGRISPSMKKKRYFTVLKFVGIHVIWSDCDCPAGKGKCKHAMALLYALVNHIMLGKTEIPEYLACTSQPRQWGRVSAKPVATDGICNFSDLVPRTVYYDPDNPDAAVTQSLRGDRQLQYTSLPEAATKAHTARQHALTQHHPFWHSLIRSHDHPDSTSAIKTEPKSPDNLMMLEPLTTDIIPDITNCIKRHGPMEIDDNILHPFNDELDVSHITETGACRGIDPKDQQTRDITSAGFADTHYSSYRKELELRTRGQSDSTEWQNERKGRITASIIGSIFKRRQTTSPRNLLNRINQVDQQDLSHVKAIQHGRKFEKTAREHYEHTNNVVIEDRGLMLHPTLPWLGASTDGVISDPPSVVEIKCPLFKGNREHMLIDLAREKKHQQWFLIVDDNKLKLNRTHNYLYQCQIQMECLELNRCMFIVYLCDNNGYFIDCYCELIHKDEVLIHKLIAKAKDFYDLYLV